ncbi:hypothetical protein [Alistipes putredinis]|uniref:hypothetical protein n=1 Tax=Alistipes putredinis TaxID=28117 RepID=UPI0034A1C140
MDYFNPLKVASGSELRRISFCRLYIPEQNIAGPWGFFYVAQDESGAWGELHYEEVLLTEDKYEDPRTAPMDGFDNKKTWAVKSAASVAFPAPIRFSKASFMQVTESFGGF